MIAGLDDDQNLYMYCGGGYRSVIATSLIKKQGIHNLRNVLGGWAKIKEEKRIPTEKDISVLN
jgi:rhodanese-related sulfurtransferase